MNVPASHKTACVERVRGGLIISFSDAEEGLYSDELLYALLPEARRLLAEAMEETDSPEP